MRQGAGQAAIVLASRPVMGVLRDDETPSEIRRRLLLVEASRRFARDALGLEVHQQYRRVTFLDQDAVVYVVSAAPQTDLTLYRWHYPVLGALPYRGYFSLEEAEAAALDLEAQGYDVAVRPVPTYSLLGIFPDPIVSPMLLSSDPTWLIETVIHELTHATVFAPGQGAFNEGVATFIGREGRRQFIEHHFGEDSAISTYQARLDRDRDTYARAVRALAFELRVLFATAQGRGRDTLAAHRDQIYARHQSHFVRDVADTMQTYRFRRARLPENNAALSAYGLYTAMQSLYRRAFDVCQHEMRCFLRQMRWAAAHSDAELALETWLREREDRSWETP